MKIAEKIILFSLLAISMTFAQSSWKQTNGLTSANVLSLFATSSGNLLCGTNGSGIFRTTDKGNSWVQSDTGPGKDTVIYSFYEGADNIIYAGTGQGRIIESSDDGQTWTPEPSANGSILGATVSAGAATPGVLLFNNKLFLSVQYLGEFISADGGINWSKSTSGLTTADVRKLIIDKNNNILLATGTGIFKSTDNGSTWMTTGNSLSSKIIFSLLQSSDGSLFAGTYLGTGIYKSTDGGATWSQVNNGLDFLTLIAPVHDLAQDPGGNLYAGFYQKGVFKSADNGASWTDFNTGLTNKGITALAVDKSGTLFAGTSAGVFVYSATTGIKQVNNIIPEKFRLMQNYPNPFNPSTTIQFSIPKKNFVTLKIYDTLGREVATLVNKELEAGTYNYNWNADNLTSGIYFYKILAGNYVVTKKMMLLK